MKNTSIALFFCLALWFPSQSDALIIMIPDKANGSYDVTQYYAAGMCRDKYKEAGKMFVWQDFINQNSKSVLLAKGEAICIIGTGSPGTVGTVTSSAGYNISGVLIDRISNPNDAEYSLLYASYSAVSGNGGPSLIQGMYDHLSNMDEDPWQGKMIYGSNGFSFSNQTAKEPYYLSALEYPRPTSGPCSQATDPSEALDIKFKVMAAYSACLISGGSFSGIADCIYKDSNIKQASLAYSTYMQTNECTSNGTTSMTVP